MQVHIKALIVLSATVISACASNGVSTMNQTSSKAPIFEYEKKIEKNQSEVWDKLVKNIAKSFFVINNIDKESRIINLSYSSNRPQDYVDCGRTQRTYKDSKITENYDYGVTDNMVTYRISPNQQSDHRFSTVGTIVRTTSLEGRANVYVAPEGSGTVVSVNAKSIVKINVQGEILTQNFAGVIVARNPIPQNTAELTSVTKGPTVGTITNGTTPLNFTCYSTGRLEQDILELTN